jgi:hypothetical protein
MFKSIGGALGIAPMALGALDFQNRMNELKKKAEQSKSGKVMYRMNNSGMPEVVNLEDLVV